MIGPDEIAARRDSVASSPDLGALLGHLRHRAAPVIERMPVVPAVKALLSRDGGTCPHDGAPLRFDPWQPEDHRCSACARVQRGPRHHAHWARQQHLWIASRAAHLATLHALTGDAGAAARATELLRAHHAVYHELPNRDNVLGPSHLFFSTYLESIWLLDHLAAATILRATGVLAPGDVDATSAVADEAATLIGSFDEGMSNRQVWNAAALTAVATWFEDEDLAQSAVTGRTGLLGHLTDGFGDDGMWHEGENYHLFAMRGLLLGLHWASHAGLALTDDPELAAHLAAALLAPTRTVLPDFTFPARKDARYGVSVAHPAYHESWEAGLALLGDSVDTTGLVQWLSAIEGRPLPYAVVYDAYLHDEGTPPLMTASRTTLSWWSAWLMRSALPGDAPPWQAPDGAMLLPSQGLALLRDGGRYVSVECRSGGGGHGHPDSMHLTVHDGGVHWLRDPGTGSYVADDLAWYRSTLAHNAPRVDGADQPQGVAGECLAIAADGPWAHVRCRWHGLVRTIVSGPDWILSHLAWERDTSTVVELPWHPAGHVAIEAAEADPSLDGGFVSGGRRAAAGDGVTLATCRAGDDAMRLLLTGGDVIVADVPGLPYSGSRSTMLVQRSPAARGVIIGLVDLGGHVTGLSGDADRVTVTSDGATVAVSITASETVIEAATGRTQLGGMVPRQRSIPTFAASPPERATGWAMRTDAAPALDGTEDGFDTSAPLHLDDELAYLRSEEEYPGAEHLAATAWLNWEPDTLYACIEVMKDALVIRERDAEPLELDNEHDDIHADGIQLHVLRNERQEGWLVRPTGEGLAVRGIGNTDANAVRGTWRRIDGGYMVTVAVALPGIGHRIDSVESIRFELLVNEMQPGRVRRAGQLAWSSGPGWVYLRGDRCDPASMGLLELHP